MTRAIVTLRFYEELNDFLPPARQKRSYERPLFLSPTVKDVIEAEGVPHPEVDLVLVDGVSVGFEHRLQGGERIAVYPIFEGVDIAPLQRLRPLPLRRPRFILDVHLGRLARQLRLLGFDCWYRNDYSDPAIVEQAAATARIILTRDIGLLKHGAVTRGYWVRDRRSSVQVREVLRRFDLWARIDPLTRCTVCNAPIRAIAREQVPHRVPAGVRARHAQFFHCPGCDRVYWPGTHYEALLERIEGWRSGI
jgi:hypothetical protein